jgi:hypothetical protein
MNVTTAPVLTPGAWQQQQRPSPVADLISKHRAEMAEIWQRHTEALKRPRGRAA